ncbi:hypothetical protein [Streptomyces sp. NPDC048272]
MVVRRVVTNEETATDPHDTPAAGPLRGTSSMRSDSTKWRGST